MKLKAMHLLRRMERIDRDLEELQQLQNSIQDDRAYARSLRESLQEEFSRLRQFKSRILSQIILSPPDSLTGEESVPVKKIIPEMRRPAEKKPEITIPVPRKTQEGSALKIPSPKSPSSDSAKDTVPKRPAFRFVYDNKSNL